MDNKILLWNKCPFKIISYAQKVIINGYEPSNVSVTLGFCQDISRMVEHSLCTQEV